MTHRARRTLTRTVFAAATWAIVVVPLPPAAAEEEAGQLVPSAAPDWSQWRGPTRSGISTETGLLKEWPETGPVLLWTADGMGKGFSSPIIVGDTIYLSGDMGDELTVFALDRGGKQKWRASNGKRWKRSHPGSRSSGCYDDGRVFFMNAHGRLACFNAVDGKELWSVDIVRRFESKNITWGISESVLVDGNAVFVTPVGKKALMAALDKKTGQTLWTTPALADELPTYSSPILIETGGQKQLVSCGTKNVFGVDSSTGVLLWKHPHVIPDWVVGTSPVFAKNSVYVSNATKDAGKMYRLRIDGDKPEIAWSTAMGDTYGGNVVCINDMVFGSLKRRQKGWLVVSAETGKTQASDPDIYSGSVVYADDRFYCLTTRGTMVLVKVADGELETVGKLQVVTGNKKNVWAHPVVCNGRLYVRYHDRLHCYDIRE